MYASTVGGKNAGIVREFSRHPVTNFLLLQSAPERSQKDLTKSSNCVQQQIINSYNKSNKPNAVTKENPSELVNGYSHVNGYTESSDAKQERGRPRARKDDKGDAEFFNQIACTMQNLQKDLDRITARVRNLEGQALTVLAPQPVSVEHFI